MTRFVEEDEASRMKHIEVHASSGEAHSDSFACVCVRKLLDNSQDSPTSFVELVLSFAGGHYSTRLQIDLSELGTASSLEWTNASGKSESRYPF